MATKVSLTEVIDALEIATDEMSSFVSKRTGQVIMLSHEAMHLAEDDSKEDLPDWQKQELRLARDVLGSTAWLGLPSKFDVHEWEIMNRFGQSLTGRDDVAPDQERPVGSLGKDSEIRAGAVRLDQRGIRFPNDAAVVRNPHQEVVEGEGESPTEEDRRGWCSRVDSEQATGASVHHVHRVAGTSTSTDSGRRRLHDRGTKAARPRRKPSSLR